jgi:GNAT superfamily N-acetyltransferase
MVARWRAPRLRRAARVVVRPVRPPAAVLRWDAWHGIGCCMDIGGLALRGQVEWFRYLVARGCAHLAVDDGFAVASGLPSNTDNGAVVSAGSLHRPTVLDRLLSWLGHWQLPGSVIVTGPLNVDVVPQLTDRGLVAENAGHEMGRPLTAADSARPAALPPGIRVAEVTDSSALRDSYQVYRGDGWFEEPDEFDHHLDVANRLGFGAGHQIRHWAAHWDGNPVGAATSFLFGDTVMLVKCCVARRFRRRGIGTALTRTRLAAAYRDGASQAVLSPSPDGYQLHRSLRFTLVPLPPNRWFYQF